MAADLSRIPNYDVEEKPLSESTTSILYKATRQSDKKKVVLKLLSVPYPKPEQIAAFKNEYNILKELEGIPGLIRVLEQISIDKSTALVFERINGISLNFWITDFQMNTKNRPPNLETLISLLTLFSSICDSLFRMHALKVVHNDVNPFNIMWDAARDVTKIIDFGSSFKLYKGLSSSPILKESSFLYAAPEQFGNHDKTVDFRSDFYSLGCTMYHTFTGKPPFVSNDPLEIMHFHTAKEPIPIHKLQTDFPEASLVQIPKALSDIVMKLLAKDCKDRYQNAHSIKKDIDSFLEILRSGVNVPDDFEIGKYDQHIRFEVPDKLYGRDQSLDIIMPLIDQVFYARQRHLVFVTGQAGVGKTKFVNYLERLIAKRKGIFVRGRFEEFNANRPFTGIFQVASALLQRILKGSKTQFNEYCEKIRDIFEGDPKDVLELLPELALILKPIEKRDDAADSVIPFQRRLQDLFMFFSSKDAPLVIFLDGFQFADLSSIKLLQSVMSYRKTNHILIIAAYRTDPEKFMDYKKMVDSFKTLSIPLTEIQLNELAQENVLEIICDAMGSKEMSNSPGITDLAQSIHKKTMGNPTFLISFLNEVVDLGYISCKENDQGENVWVWDIDKIDSLSATENTAKLVINKISSVPKEVVEVLQVCSCFGGIVFPVDIAAVLNKPLDEASLSLETASKFGILMSVHVNAINKIKKFDPEGSKERTMKTEVISKDSPSISVAQESPVKAEKTIKGYRFAHDRLHNLIYNGFDSNTRLNYHWNIGEYLHKLFIIEDEHKDSSNKTIPESERQATSIRIFDVVDQFNMGKLPENESSALMLAELNYKAGKTAKSSGAYLSAINYFGKAIKLIDEKYWKHTSSTEYRLLLDVHLDAFRISHLCGDESGLSADHLQEVLKTHTAGKFDRVLYKTIVNHIYLLKSEYSNIIENCLKILTLLQRTIRNGLQLGLFDMIPYKHMLQTLTADDLRNRPVCKSKRIILSYRILLWLVNASYQSCHPVYYAAYVTFIRLGVEYQLPLSPIAYFMLGREMLEIGRVDVGRQIINYGVEDGLKKPAAIRSIIVGYYENICVDIVNSINSEIGFFSDTFEEFFRDNDSEFGVIFFIRSMTFSLYFGHSISMLNNKFRLKMTEILKMYKLKSSIEEYNFLLQQFLDYMNGVQELPVKLEFWNIKGYAVDKNNTGDYMFYQFQRCYVQMLLDFFLSHQSVALASAIQFQEKSGSIYDSAKSPDGLWPNFIEALIILKNMLCGDGTASATSTGRASVFSGKEKSLKIQVPPTWKLWLRINRTYRRFKKYSAISIDNYLNSYLILKACRAAAKGKVVKALTCFDQAIVEAERVRNIRNWAIANEFKGIFFIKIEQYNSALLCFTEASYLYKLWGAPAKVADLESLINKINDENHLNYKQNIGSSEERNSTVTGATTANIDIFASLKLAQTLSGVVSYKDLVEKLLKLLLQNSGAQKAQFIEMIEEEPFLVSEAFMENNKQDGNSGMEEMKVQNINMALTADFSPITIINFAGRMKQPVVLTDANNSLEYQDDPYILQHHPKSLMCIPIIVNEKNVLKGICYLENKLVAGAFTPERLRLTNILAIQAAITIENFNLSRKNEELINALTKKSDLSKYDMDAPIKRVLDILINLKGNAKDSPTMGNMVGDIDFILQTLISNTLFSLDLDGINDGKGNKIDEQTKIWINSTMMTQFQPQAEKRNDSAFEKNRKSFDKSYKARKSIAPAVTQIFEADFQEFEDGNVESWSFSVFQLVESGSKYPLQKMGMYVFTRLDLAKQCNVPSQVFFNWLTKIESKYHTHPYHNNLHATDVLHAMYVQLIVDNPILEGHLTPFELFAIVFSAAAHDVDHPGVNNIFLMKTSSHLSLLYNDTSVLEAHHASTAFQVTMSRECDVFAEFKESEYRDVRKLALSLILSTDLSKHFEILNKFKTKISTTGIDPNQTDDRRLLIEIGIKLADVNNSSRNLDLAREWTRRIMEEFYLQGEQEKANEIEVSMFMDRQNSNVPKCQLGFIDIFVAPLYDAWGTVIKSETVNICKENISKNRKHWADLLEETNKINSEANQSSNQLK